MSTVTRGVRNAFRNPIRTGSVIALLGIATALALALFLANQAVKAKITDLKSHAATTLTINSAGAFGGEGGGEPLTTADVDKVKALANVSEVGAIMSSGGGMFRVFGGSQGTAQAQAQAQAPTSNVNLDSSIDPGTLGRRRFRAGANPSSGDASAPLPDIKLPVALLGLEGNLDRTGTPFKITSGTAKFSGADVPEALVGQGLATKNNLTAGSTFTAYNTTLTPATNSATTASTCPSPRPSASPAKPARSAKSSCAPIPSTTSTASKPRPPMLWATPASTSPRPPRAPTTPWPPSAPSSTSPSPA
jgi:putative ABC transport system permease protein